MSNSLAVPGFLDAIAILFGALTGAMAATRRGLDWFGVLIVAFCTGVGGGIIRDILLQNGVPALLSNPRYQLYATIGAIVGLFFAKGAARFQPVYVGVDTLMIGVWVLLGASKAQQLGIPTIGIIFVGTVSAIGGAVLRDVLVHEKPDMLQPGHLYAAAALAAAVTYTALSAWSVPLGIAQLSAIAMAAGLRTISVRFDIVTPSPYDVSTKVLQAVHLETRY